ncbi:uncharacterized protein CTRU02_208960 [Colletotrichum truncatum]|uniref:Uncharacterized protein n=1 Tax=Colletotrichum truncatum TaxID=5467 RepID=A0ACC3YXR2_COLTU|nr:uncharacterized protein CTRU02_07849 [Colletotrichum truncatum]KAF6790942.1 hypothetical protein CTRU02_07849 [Colletotrichum truncatum]
MATEEAHPEEHPSDVAGPTDCNAEPGSSSVPSQAHPQQQSGFFSALPLEIRQDIYRHLWAAAGLTQHVYKSSPSVLAPLSHCACITDPNAEDVREIELARILDAPPADLAPDGPMTEEAAIQRDEINDWRLRNASQWCNHWECEEAPPILRPLDERTSDHKDDSKSKKQPVLVKEFSPFLAVLLSCKRMHQEAVNSIYDNTTFSFIGTDALTRFLETTTAESLARIKALHMIWPASIESYMDPADPEAEAARIKWNELWMSLSLKTPRLRELRVWMYPQYARYPMPHEEWFKPLHQFKHVPKYEISLRWFMDPSQPLQPETGPLDFLEEAPFEYDRVPPLLDNPLQSHWRRLIALYLDEPRSMPARRQKKKKRYLGRS